MARRESRTTSRRDTSRRDDYVDDAARGRGRKSEREGRIERVTWFLLVFVFGILYVLPESTAIPNYIVPIAGATILLGSGFIQYTQRMPVNPITWIGGTIMLALAFYSYFLDPLRDLLGISLIVFALVIGIGVLTGET
jgi:hypothetical protein